EDRRESEATARITFIPQSPYEPAYHRWCNLFMFDGLEHTAIASPNPKDLAEWYAGNLEFVINFGYDGNYFVRVAKGTTLEMPSVGDRGSNQMKDPGIRHLAIEV